jgi:hypothetical protein
VKNSCVGVAVWRFLLHGGDLILVVVVIGWGSSQQEELALQEIVEIIAGTPRLLLPISFLHVECMHKGDSRKC